MTALFIPSSFQFSQAVAIVFCVSLKFTENILYFNQKKKTAAALIPVFSINFGKIKTYLPTAPHAA